MRLLGVIPARYDSTRFPGKPLADLGGKSMIQRVAEQALQAQKLSKVVVATDDERIFIHLREKGIECVMTANTHRSGTERLIEVMDHFDDYDGYVNIQGDEPFIHPNQIDLVCRILIEKKGALVGTLVKRTHDTDEIRNPNIVKAVVGTGHEALFFSRLPIPYYREIPGGINTAKGHLKHIGIYAYTAEALDMIRWMEPSKLEMAESLEQLRWLENGVHIFALETHEETIAVDTPEDLERARQLI